VHVIGVAKNPDWAWVTQQARNLAVGERLKDVWFVILPTSGTAFRSRDFWQSHRSALPRAHLE
jgi:hypothetical protein